MREKSNVKGKNTEIQGEIKGTRAKEEIEKVKGGNKKYRWCQRRKETNCIRGRIKFE